MSASSIRSSTAAGLTHDSLLASFIPRGVGASPDRALENSQDYIPSEEIFRTAIESISTTDVIRRGN
jgi:hypothetical protein